MIALDVPLNPNRNVALRALLCAVRKAAERLIDKMDRTAMMLGLDWPDPVQLLGTKPPL